MFMWIGYVSRRSLMLMGSVAWYVDFRLCQSPLVEKKFVKRIDAMNGNVADCTKEKLARGWVFGMRKRYLVPEN